MSSANKNSPNTKTTAVDSVMRICHPKLAASRGNHAPSIRPRRIYLNPTFTESITGVSSKESETIPRALYRHCQSPNFQCRTNWKTGVVGIWDNRATWRKVENNYQRHYRLLHRIRFEGCTLSGSKSMVQVSECDAADRSDPYQKYV